MNQHDDFKQLSEQQSPGLLAEFWMFLSQNKKWWLLPILMVMLLLGALIMLSGSTMAPFIYTLF